MTSSGIPYSAKQDLWAEITFKKLLLVRLVSMGIWSNNQLQYQTNPCCSKIGLCLLFAKVCLTLQKVLLVPSADFYHLPDKDHMTLHGSQCPY